MRASLRLRERVAQDLERDARDLDVHLQRGDAALGAGDLEVHVAEVVLDAGDVGQDDVVLALLDQAHRDPGDRALDRHAGVHQRQRGAAHRGHRGGAVGLEDVRDHADRVGELLDRGHHRRERPLGERAVADVAALDAAHAARLADRERREVVVVPVVLFRLQAERVEAHLLLERAQRGDAERLRLTAREQRRAVRARRDADFDRDVADLVLGAPVGALLVHGDALADDRLLELVERELDRGAALLGGEQLLLGGALRRRRRVLLEHRLPRPPWWRPGARACPRPGWPSSSAAPCEARIASRIASSTAIVSNSFFSLPTLRGELALQRAQLLDLRVGDVERVEDLGLGDLVGARLDHQDRLLGAGDDQVEVRAALGVAVTAASGGQVLLAGVDDEVAVDLADAHRADGRRERDVGDHHRGRGAVHREDVVGVDVVDRERDRHQLRVVAPVLGEQRAQRAVDHARGQRRLLARAALALEERAGDLPGRVHALLDVHRQREEVDVAQGARRRPSRAPSCRPGGRPLRRRPAWPSCRSQTRSRCPRSPRRPA